MSKPIPHEKSKKRKINLRDPLDNGDPTPEKAAAERLLAVEVRLHCAEHTLRKVVEVLEDLRKAPRPAYCGRPDLRIMP